MALPVARFTRSHRARTRPFYWLVTPWLLCIMLAVGSPVSAQDGSEENGALPASTGEESAEIPTEAPMEIPTDEPEVFPTDVPVEIPTDVPVEIPTDVPVEIPTDEPVVEPTIEPTIEPTVTPTPSPTSTPSPTPTLAYALSPSPECIVAPNQPAVIASGGTLEYVCTDRVAITGTLIVPGNVSLQWNVQVAFEGGWGVQILPPTNPGQTAEWSTPDAGSAQFTFTPIQPAGTSADPVTLETTSEITFGLRVQRPACGLESIPLVISHGVDVQSLDAIAEPATASDPLRLYPDLQPLPNPVVTFAGPLDFGEVRLTSTGLDAPVRQGTLNVVVSDLSSTCGDWTLHLSSTQLTDRAGLPLDGSTLVVTSIDGVVLPDGGCDLAQGCDLMTLTGGADAPMTATHELSVELRMPETPGIGAFHTSVSAVLDPVAGG